MTLRSWLDALPDKHTPERDDMIVRAIRSGMVAPIHWVEVPVEHRDHEGRVFVSADALAVGDADKSVRVNLPHPVADGIADHFGCVLPTPRISDLIYKNAQVIGQPCLQTPDANMADTDRMVQHSQMVDEKMRGRCGLRATVGKDWVNTKRLVYEPTRAANYGWHGESARYKAATTSARIWQPVGLVHSLRFTDYSQVTRLVRRDMIVDGEERDIVDVAADPVLCGLVSHEGAIAMRHPANRIKQGSLPPPSHPRRTRRGDPADEVRAWQTFLLQWDPQALPRYGADGDHGTETEEWSQRWESARGMARVETFSFVEAKHYRKANRQVGDVTNIVIHTTENPWAKGVDGAMAVARYFATTKRPASSHYVIDAEPSSIVQCVSTKDIAYCAPGLNRTGIHLEHFGRAKYTRDEWLSSYGMEVLTLSAKLAAELCKRWEIPARFCSAEDLYDGKQGLTGHVQVSRSVGKGRTNHGDPGKGWPWGVYLRMVNKFLV